MQSQNKGTFQNLSMAGNYPGMKYTEEQFQGSCFFSYRETEMAKYQRLLSQLQQTFLCLQEQLCSFLLTTVLWYAILFILATIHKVATCSFLLWKPNFYLVRFTAEKNKERTVTCSSLCFSCHGMYLFIWITFLPDKRCTPAKRVLVKIGSLTQKARPKKNQIRS